MFAMFDENKFFKRLAVLTKIMKAIYRKRFWDDVEDDLKKIRVRK